MMQQQANAGKNPLPAGQAGGGLLGFVAIMGAVLAVVQGGIYYQSRTSANFLSSEKKKILSQQMAEAGVEENIADIGSRKLRVRAGLDTLTYANKPLGIGSYTTRLTTVGVGSESDTVDLFSTGLHGAFPQMVTARLRLKKYLDTNRTPITVVAPETILVVTPRSVPETTFSTTVQDPNTMPAFNATPAYSACLSSPAPKCDVCHLPGGVVASATVLNMAKTVINTHLAHRGDYVTTDGSCDVYKPRLTPTSITSSIKLDSSFTVVDRTVYDSTMMVVDTAVKVQVLSWK